ncbi:hypothetical protein HDA32_001539 [Spinactinospora alkalitolerans]|uniref:Uncharacterized protein n=1 Tax=Spinactinospora alkalitolerans TaxID=687207 RepID=A0A852TR05_9ACTN|nr:hypothetical protein [Spinactinospora alkalitolerans]
MNRARARIRAEAEAVAADPAEARAVLDDVEPLRPW